MPRCLPQNIPIKITQINAPVLSSNRLVKNSLLILGQSAELHIVCVCAICFMICAQLQQSSLLLFNTLLWNCFQVQCEVCLRLRWRGILRCWIFSANLKKCTTRTEPKSILAEASLKMNPITNYNRTWKYRLLRGTKQTMVEQLLSNL